MRSAPGMFDPYAEPYDDEDPYGEPDIFRGVSVCDVADVHKREPAEETFPLFDESDVPPEVPSDPWFRLEPTTVVIQCRSPACAANRLFAHLQRVAEASVLKVRRAKFSVKAHVCRAGLMCELKVRLYRQQGDYLVEFRRCSGDALSFASAYRSGSDHLLARAEGNLNDSSRTVPDFQLMDTSSLGPWPEPLLELGQTDDVALQSEAIAGLADIAGCADWAARLCAPETFAICRNFLQVDDLNIALPTAHLLSQLSQCPEARQLFSDFGVLPPMLDKAQAQLTHESVKKHLAQAMIYTSSS